MSCDPPLLPTRQGELFAARFLAERRLLLRLLVFTFFDELGGPQDLVKQFGNSLTGHRRNRPVFKPLFESRCQTIRPNSCELTPFQCHLSTQLSIDGVRLEGVERSSPQAPIIADNATLFYRFLDSCAFCSMVND